MRSPFILGLFRPNIYIPFDLDPEKLHLVLAHEQIHLSRRDYIIKPLAFLFLILHWFNPLCWLAFFLMCRETVYHAGLSRQPGCEDRVYRAYSSCLLWFAANRRFPSPSPLAFGESSVQIRIKHALSWKKRLALSYDS